MRAGRTRYLPLTPGLMLLLLMPPAAMPDEKPATPAPAAGKYARHTVRDAPPRATLTLKRPSAVVTSGTLDVAVPALGVAANASTRAPAIGEPSARVTRPSIVCARAKLLVSVAFAEPRQSALRTAPPVVAPPPVAAPETAPASPTPASQPENQHAPGALMYIFTQPSTPAEPQATPVAP